MSETRGEAFPVCPSCPHAWHGLQCEVRWIDYQDGRRQVQCPCETSCAHLFKPPNDG